MRRTWLLLALLGCPKPPPPEPGPAPDTAPAPPEGFDATMQHHAALAAGARDAVIAGDLEGARKLGGWLSAYSNEGVPEAWMPRLLDLRASGRELYNTPDLASAATAVGRIAQTCGACHAETGPGPAFVFDEAPAEETTVLERMARHQWAAERMWEGLVTPSAALYQTGARAVSGAPLWNAETLPDAVAPMEAVVREVAEFALSAESEDARADAYARLITVCSQCHAIAR